MYYDKHMTQMYYDKLMIMYYDKHMIQVYYDKLQDVQMIKCIDIWIDR